MKAIDPCYYQLSTFCGEFITQDSRFTNLFCDEFWRLFSHLESQSQSRIMINPGCAEAAKLKTQAIYNLATRGRRPHRRLSTSFKPLHSLRSWASISFEFIERHAWLLAALVFLAIGIQFILRAL